MTRSSKRFFVISTSGKASPADRSCPPPLESGYVREPFYDDLPFGPESYAE